MAFDRRKVLQGAVLAGAVLAKPALAAHVQAARPVKPLRNGFQPCRFGQVHYRYSQPDTDSRHLPFLCMHGSPGSGLFYGDFLPLIGSDRLAIAADAPGYGLSDRPQTPSTIEDFAGAMSDLVDGLGLKRIDLLGNHTSSATALELVRQRPGLVRRIVLNSAMMYTPEDLVKMRAGVANVAAASLDAAADRIPAQWRLFRKARADVSEERAWRLFWDTNRDPTHLDWGYKASFDYDFPAALAQTRQPMLILNARDVLFEITARARGKFNGEVRDLPWSGGTFGVHAAEIAQLIRGFLDAKAP